MVVCDIRLGVILTLVVYLPQMFVVGISGLLGILLMFDQTFGDHDPSFVGLLAADDDSYVKRAWRYLTEPVKNVRMSDVLGPHYEEIISGVYWLVVYAKYNGVPPDERLDLVPAKPTMSPSELMGVLATYCK